MGWDTGLASKTEAGVLQGLQPPTGLAALLADYQSSGLTWEEYLAQLKQAQTPQITPPFTPPMGPPAPEDRKSVV